MKFDSVWVNPNWAHFCSQGRKGREMPLGKTTAEFRKSQGAQPKSFTGWGCQHFVAQTSCVLGMPPAILRASAQHGTVCWTDVSCIKIPSPSHLWSLQLEERGVHLPPSVVMAGLFCGGLVPLKSHTPVPSHGHWNAHHAKPSGAGCHGCLHRVKSFLCWPGVPFHTSSPEWPCLSLGAV